MVLSPESWLLLASIRYYPRCFDQNGHENSHVASGRSWHSTKTIINAGQLRHVPKRKPKANFIYIEALYKLVIK